MRKEKNTIEKRLENIKNLYYNLDDFVDKLPDAVPEDVKKLIKNQILKNEELKDLINGIERNRPPRFMLVGRTGAGKSSLINAICGLYTAKVSDVRIGTKEIERFQSKEGDRTLLEILDTRGIGESISSQKGKEAEVVLKEEMIKLKPDAILFVLPIDSRAHINIDAAYIKEIKKEYKKEMGIDIPVFVVLNKADAMQPIQYDNPFEYSARKLDNIRLKCCEVEKIIREVGLEVEDIIPVSSMIDWGYSPEELEEMKPERLEKLKIKLDGRYNITKLIDTLEKNIDSEAAMGLMFAASLEKALERIADKLIGIFTAIAGVVAANPLPIADMVVLTSLEVVMVSLIAYLSGEELSIKAAEKFIGSLFGIGIGGNIFRLTARQLSKMIPGGGFMISAGIASGGMYVIGKSAIQYYIYGRTMNSVSGIYKKFMKEFSNK